MIPKYTKPNFWSTFSVKFTARSFTYHVLLVWCFSYCFDIFYASFCLPWWSFIEYLFVGSVSRWPDFSCSENHRRYDPVYFLLKSLFYFGKWGDSLIFRWYFPRMMQLGEVNDIFLRGSEISFCSLIHLLHKRDFLTLRNNLDPGLFSIVFIMRKNNSIIDSWF